MKKTYYAPQILNVKLNTVQMLAGSNLKTFNDPGATITNEENVLSKGFSGGLWDEEVEE